MTVYYAGVTVYAVGRNVCNAVWCRPQNTPMRRAFNPQDGTLLSFYVEKPQGFAVLEAFVEYQAASMHPVPIAAVQHVTQIAMGLIEQFKDAGGSPLILAPGGAAH